MKIYKEKAGVISSKKVWCCIHNGYLYTGKTLKELIKILNSEWEADKYLVG